MTKTTLKNKITSFFPRTSLHATPGVTALVPHLVQTACLARHLQGDWGDVCEEDRNENEASYRTKGMVLSVYDVGLPGCKTLWIITDPGHHTTTFLLPEEY